MGSAGERCEQPSESAAAPGRGPAPNPWGRLAAVALASSFPIALTAGGSYERRFALVFSLAVGGSGWGLLALGRFGRHREGRCFQCGYDLTGNASGVCPECGTRAGNDRENARPSIYDLK